MKQCTLSKKMGHKVQMALDLGMNLKRSFDVAVSDYYHHGNDLLWKKHIGDREKPQNCDLRMYPWYVRKQKRST